VPLLSVRDLEVKFFTRKATINAVNRISFDLDPGDTLGVVGESGCGKSVSSLAILGILPKPAGKVTNGQALFQDRDLISMPDGDLRTVRGRHIAMIFQDPMTSLNPVLTIGKQITEALRKHLEMNKAEADKEAATLLERVGIPAAKDRLGDYPHQFSGGMRQRVMIAMAISCKPRVLIADEPTTALDVTIQAQILEVLGQLVAEEDMALILITHDLGVVAGICERTNVMYAGRFVETAPTAKLFAKPRHPYTVGLLKSVPRLDSARKERLDPIVGSPPNLAAEITGCAFAPRCSYATQESYDQVPVLRAIDGPDHLVACWNPVPDADLPEHELVGAEPPSAPAR
jgi:oligopeptide transport system ATP-binding protein